MAATIEGRGEELLKAPNFCNVATFRRDGTIHGVPVWVDVQDGRPTLRAAVAATPTTRPIASGATMEPCPGCRPRHGGACDVRRTASPRRIGVHCVVVICPRSASIC